MLQNATNSGSNEAAMSPSHQPLPSSRHPSHLTDSSSAGSLSSAADVAVAITGSSSIYDLRSRTTRWLILVGVAVAALLVPFTGEFRFLPGCVLSCCAAENHRAATTWARWQAPLVHTHLAWCQRAALPESVACCVLASAAADSIYFPALPAVGKDLHASEAAVAATVAVFLFTVGLGNLFW